MSVKLEVKDVAELEAKINGLSFICDKGKAEFKSIIESFGINFNDKNPTPMVGQVWFYGNQTPERVRLILGFGYSITSICNLDGYLLVSNKTIFYIKSYLSSNNYKFGYNTLSEYYQALAKERK